MDACFDPVSLEASRVASSPLCVIPWQCLARNAEILQARGFDGCSEDEGMLLYDCWFDPVGANRLASINAIALLSRRSIRIRTSSSLGVILWSTLPCIRERTSGMYGKFWQGLGLFYPQHARHYSVFAAGPDCVASP
jgi:hypothetical protein